jgi:hypothetical protein
VGDRVPALRIGEASTPLNRLNDLVLRREVQSPGQQATGERVAKLEAVVKPAIQGNGEPSRLAVVEGKVEELQKFSWKWTGIASACGVVAAFLVEVLKHKVFRFLSLVLSIPPFKIVLKRIIVVTRAKSPIT